MADKDQEILNYKSKLEWLEEKNVMLQSKLEEMEEKYKNKVEEIKCIKTKSVQKDCSVINEVKKEDVQSNCDSKSNDSVILNEVCVYFLPRYLIFSFLAILILIFCSE